MGRVLILAGTREARAVCAAGAGLDVLASLAGATRAPRDLGVPTRFGGFGGEEGFRAAMAGVRAVLDATHPFATAMSARAARVCRDLGVPHLRLSRAAWPMEAGWRRHPDAAEAAAALPPGARVFLATGPGSVAPFLDRGLLLWCRRVDAAESVPGVCWIVGPPSGLAEEAALVRRLAVSHLVAKNSGGNRAKLDAARACGVAVHMIDRPPPVAGEETHDIYRAIAFVRAHASALPPDRGGCGRGGGSGVAGCA